MTNYKTTPPSWCKDAVPSSKGWHHPKTNELLVSVLGGVNLQEYQPLDLKEVPEGIPVIQEDPKDIDVIDENLATTPVMSDEEEEEQEILQENQEDIEEPVKKRRGRKPKALQEKE